MNFNNVFRWHYLVLLLLTLTMLRAMAANILLVPGGSMKADDRIPTTVAWPALLNEVKHK